MATVTQRIEQISQPIGGLLSVSSMETIIFDDSKSLHNSENIHPGSVGMVVDYMTRFLTGTTIETAFELSLKGAKNKASIRNDNSVNQINTLLNAITGIDDVSIINACKAVSYDVWYRNAFNAIKNNSDLIIIPDKNTISNIRTMLERCITFFSQYGPVIDSGFTFESNGYSSIVDKGDGDYLTKDGLWDFKVSKSEPKPKDTLQILMYYIMGKHSGKDEFSKIKQIGIFNPRLNKAYTINTSKLSIDLINLVEKDIICYDLPEMESWEYGLERSWRIGKWIIPAKTYDLAKEICEKASRLKCIIHADVSNPLNKKKECYLYMYEDDIDGHVTLINYLNENNYLPLNKEGNYKDIAFKLNDSEFWPYYEGVFDKPLHLSHIVDLDKGTWNETFLRKKEGFLIRRTIEEKIARYDKTYHYGGELGAFRKEHRFNGEYLREQLSEKGMTITNLADMLGVKEGTVQNWIKGKSRPLIGKAMELCVRLNLEEDRLILKH